MNGAFLSLFYGNLFPLADLDIVPMGGDREVTRQMHCLNMYYCLEVIAGWFGEECRCSHLYLKVAPDFFPEYLLLRVIYYTYIKGSSTYDAGMNGDNRMM